MRVTLTASVKSREKDTERRSSSCTGFLHLQHRRTVDTTSQSMFNTWNETRAIQALRPLNRMQSMFKRNTACIDTSSGRRDTGSRTSSICRVCHCACVYQPGDYTCFSIQIAYKKREIDSLQKGAEPGSILSIGCRRNVSLCIPLPARHQCRQCSPGLNDSPAPKHM